jgi:hypothetical protein
MRKSVSTLALLAFAVACSDVGGGLLEPTLSLSLSGGGEGAQVWTDKEDYQPGDTVTITGAGWWPGEVVHINITEDREDHSDHVYDVKADEEGKFVHAELVMDEDHLGVHFTLTATGQESGYVATTTFTDAAPNVQSFKLDETAFTFPPSPPNEPATNPITVAPGATVEIEVTAATVATTGQPEATWKSTEVLYRIANSSDFIQAVCDNTNVVDPSEVKRASHIFTFTAPIEANTYDVRVRAYQGDGCTAGSGHETYNGVLIVQAQHQPSPTTTSVTCTPASVVVHQETTCTATVTDDSENGTSEPAGTVTFSTSSGGAFVSNSCGLVGTGDGESSSCSVNYTPAAVGTGTHQIKAEYDGSDDHEDSFGTFDLTVNTRETATTLSCSPGVAPADDSTQITCTATVADVDNAGTKAAPSGEVNFSRNGAPAGSCTLGSPSGVSSACNVAYKSETTTLDEIVATYAGTDVHSSSVSDPLYIAFFDPAEGFVTGGGWIDSPAGAYADDADLTGRANFGFVAQYQQRGRNSDPVLVGNTQFVFQAAGFNFHSDSYDWLVVQGNAGRAQFKGSGSVNGVADYEFMLSVVEGKSGEGKFRIKVWDGDGVVYDNQMEAADNAEPTTTIQGGSIVIHSGGQGKNQK